MKTENKSLQSLGFELSHKGPFAEVKDNWPCISYVVTLKFKGREVIETTYSLGVGHVKVTAPPMGLSMSEREAGFLHSWKARPNANFLDKQLQADVATKLAKYQKVAPQLADVLHSLMLDGEAHFQSMLFADWCADFGYDSDSIKAKEIFEKCEAIGKSLKRNIPVATLKEVQSILSNY